MAETLELVILVDTKRGIVSVRKAGGEIKKLGKTAEKFTTKGKKDFGSLWKSMAVGSLVAKGLTASLRTLKRAMSGMVTEAMDFEDEWANVTTLVTDSSVDMRALRDEVLGMAGELGSATELTRGMYQALSAGVKPGEAVAFIGDAAKFAKAGLTDMDSAVKVIATAMNVYGFRVDQASEISDIFFETNKRGMTTVNELAGSFGRVMGVAKSVGIEFKELNAIVASLTAGGIKTTETMSSLKAIVANIATPTEQARVAAKRLGIQFDIAAVSSKGFTGFMKEMTEKVKGDVQAQKDLFGSIEAFNAIAVLTSKEGMKRYTDALDAMGKKTDNTNIAFKKQQATLRATVTAMKNEFVATLIKALLPAMKELREWLSKNRDGMREFAEGIISGAKTIGSIIKILWDLRAVIIAVTLAMSAMWAVKKANVFIGVLARMRVPISDVLGQFRLLRVMGAGTFGALKETISHNIKNMSMLGKSVAVAGAAFVGWKIGRAISELLGLDKAVTNAAESTLRFLGLTHESTAVLSDYTKQHSNVASGLRQIAKGLGDTSGDFRANARTIFENKKAYAALPPEIKKVVDGMVKSAKAHEKLVAVKKKVIKTEEELKAARAAAIESAKVRLKIWREWEPQMGKVSDSLRELLGIEKEEFGIKAAINQANKKTLEQFPLLGTAWLDNMKKVKDNSKATKGWTVNWEDANEVLQFSKSILSGITDILGSLGVELNKTTDDLIGLAEGAASIAVGISKKNPAMIIQGVVSAIGSAISLLSGDGIGQAITRENSWMKMNEALTESLKELAKEVGDTHAATSLMLSDIMDQSDVTVDNFADWANRVKEIFIDLERGYISQGEFLTTMGASWTKLVGEAQRLGTEGSFEMLSIIREMENQGLKVAEIQDYILKQSSSGIAALQELATSGGGEIAAYSEAFFNSLQKQGLSFLDIINEMGGVLPETYQKFADANADILQNIGNTQTVLEALGNTNALTADAFRASQLEAASYYDTILAGGSDSRMALEAIAPLLAKQLWFAEQYNMELSDRTKELIENARAEGINVEAMIPLEELQRKQAENIERLVDIMGDFVDQLSGAAKGFEKLGNSASSAIRKMGSGGSVSFDTSKGRVPAFATGTNRQFVKEDGMFELHAGEIADVTNDDRMRITPAATAPAGGRSGGGGGNQFGDINISFPMNFQNEIAIDSGGSSPEEAASEFKQNLSDNIESIRDDITEIAKEAIKEATNVQ